MGIVDFTTCKQYGLSDTDTALCIIATQKMCGELDKEMYFDMVTALAGAKDYSALAIGEYFSCMYNPNFKGDRTVSKKVTENINKIIKNGNENRSAFESLAMASYYYFQSFTDIKNVNGYENLMLSAKELQNADSRLSKEIERGNPVAAMIYAKASKRFSLNDVADQTKEIFFSQSLSCTNVIHDYFCKMENGNGLSSDPLANICWALKENTIAEVKAKNEVANYSFPSSITQVLRFHWKDVGKENSR